MKELHDIVINEKTLSQGICRRLDPLSKETLELEHRLGEEGERAGQARYTKPRQIHAIGLRLNVEIVGDSVVVSG